MPKDLASGVGHHLLAYLPLDRLKVGRNKVSSSPTACLLFVVVQAW